MSSAAPVREYVGGVLPKGEKYAEMGWLQGLNALQGSVSESTLHSGVTKATRESCAYILEIIESIRKKRGFLGWVWWDTVSQCGVVRGRRQGQTHMQMQRASSTRPMYNIASRDLLVIRLIIHNPVFIIKIINQDEEMTKANNG
jgi:hypothetical protein